MIKNIKKPMLVAVLFCAGSAFSLSSCDTGTSPGETNVERSDIKEEGSMVVSDKEDRAKAEKDSLEKYYDHADHENHDGNKGGAVHAGDGQRQEVRKEDKKQ